MRSCPTIERQGAVARAVGCLGNPRGLERFDTGAGGGILNGEAQVLELVADGVSQIPVLGGTASARASRILAAASSTSSPV